MLPRLIANSFSIAPVIRKSKFGFNTKNVKLFSQSMMPLNMHPNHTYCSRGGTIKMNYDMYEQPHSQLKSPPILLMHGLNTDRSDWRRVARNLAKLGSRWVIAVDARNHGHSPHSTEHTPQSIANDVEAFIDDQKLGRIVALGHSTGGRALMTLALSKPKLVERLIIVDITPGPLPEHILKASELLKLMIDVVQKIPQNLSLSAGQKHIIPKFSELVKSDLDLLRIIQNLKKLDTGEFTWNVNIGAILNGWNESMVNYEQTIQNLKTYTGETLLIAARSEQFVTPANIKTMRKYFPKLQVEYLDAEHKIYLDQPKKFVQLVVDFTKTCTNCED